MSWLNLLIWTAKRGNLKMHSVMLIFFNEENEDWRKEDSTFFNFLLWRSTHRWCSIKRCVLKNFKKLTGKHLCWNVLFLITLQTWCFLLLILWFVTIFPLIGCCYIWKELKLAYLVESSVNMTMQLKRKTFAD